MYEVVIGEEDKAFLVASSPLECIPAKKRIGSAVDIFLYGYVLFRHGQSKYNFGCFQCGGRAPAAGDFELSCRGRTAGWRDCGSARTGTAFRLQAPEGAAGRGAGADALPGAAEVVPD